MELDDGSTRQVGGIIPGLHRAYRAPWGRSFVSDSCLLRRIEVRCEYYANYFITNESRQGSMRSGRNLEAPFALFGDWFDCTT